MGTCYSTHARGGATSHSDIVCPTEPPAGMPGPQQSPATSERSRLLLQAPALQKPYGGRYGFAVLTNQQPSAEEEDNDNRAPLASLTEDVVTPKPARNMNRFGFNKPSEKQAGSEANSNRKNSLDSMQQPPLLSGAGKPRVPKSTESVRKNKRGFAFSPKEGDKWRMIDEDSSISSSAVSLSRKGSQKGVSRQSLTSKTSFKSTTSTVKEETSSRVSEDIINANIPKRQSTSSLQSATQVSVDIDGRIHIPDKKSGSRLPSFPRFRGPFSRSTQSSSVDSSKSSKSSKDTPPPRTPKHEHAKNNKHNDANDKATSSSRFLRKGFFSSSKHKQAADKSSHKLSTSTSVDSAPAAATSAAARVVLPESTPSEVRKSKTSQALSSPVLEESQPSTSPTPPPPPQQSKTTALPNLGNPVLQQRLVEKSQKLPDGAAPIAMIESLETTSLGSLDDLTMLDTDVLLDDDDLLSNQHNLRSAPVRSRSGSRSRSRDSLDGWGMVTSLSSHSNELALAASSRADKKPPLLRRHTESCSSVKKRGSDRGSGGVGSGEQADTIQELASLLTPGNTQQSRRANYQRGIRPASFPGPVPSAAAAAASMPSTLLRPPRSSCSGGDGGGVGSGDEQVVTLDAYTYRQLLQDTTTTKTMLLKLKRLLQDDDLGSPMTAGAPWSKVLNGFKVSSQPSTPSCPEDLTSSARFHFSSSVATGDAGETGAGSLEALTQENAELRQQLVYQQQQIEEHERTIRLLQQQMTKYEHIDTEEGGRCFTHCSTQTRQDNKQSSPYLHAPHLSSGAAAGAAAAGASSSGQRPQQGSVHSSLTDPPHNTPIADDKNVSSMVESGIDMTSPNSEPNLAPHSPIYDDITPAALAAVAVKDPDSSAMGAADPVLAGNSGHSSMDKLRDNLSGEEEEVVTPAPVSPPVKPRPPQLSLVMTSGSMTDSMSEMSESQLWEAQVMQQLEDEEEDEEDGDRGGETMQELLEKQGIRSPPVATEIQIEKYIIATPGKKPPPPAHVTQRPDLLRGVDHVMHEDSDDQTDQSMEITAKDYSFKDSAGEEKFAAPCTIAVERQSRDSGFCRSDSNTTTINLAVGGTTWSTSGGLDYSPSDTSSFSMAVISNDDDGAAEDTDEESDLPLDTPPQKDLPVFGADLTPSAKSNSRGAVSYCIAEEEEEEIEDVEEKLLVTGGGEELAQPDVVAAEFSPVPKTGGGLFDVNPLELDKISKDLAEVEDCMNRSKDMNDAENYIHRRCSDTKHAEPAAQHRASYNGRQNESIQSTGRALIQAGTSRAEPKLQLSPRKAHTLPAPSRYVPEATTSESPKTAPVNGHPAPSRLPGASTSLPRPSCLPARPRGIPRPAAAIPRPTFIAKSATAPAAPLPSRLPGIGGGIQRVNKSGVTLRSFAGMAQK